MTTYPLCSETECNGEQIYPFGTCIRHLSSADQETYATQLKRGEGALSIAFADGVDAGFVHEWIERISTIGEDGAKVVPVDLRLEHSILINELRFVNTQFTRSLNLTGLKVPRIYIDGGFINGRLTLDYAVVESEIALVGYTQVSDRPYLQIDELTMSGCEAQHFGLQRSIVKKRLEAGKLKVETGTIIRDVKIQGPANFGDARLCEPDKYVSISAEFEGSVDFSKCKFLGHTRFGREPDLVPSIFKGDVKFDGATFGSKSFGALVMTECVFGAHPT